MSTFASGTVQKKRVGKNLSLNYTLPAAKSFGIILFFIRYQMSEASGIHPSGCHMIVSAFGCIQAV